MVVLVELAALWTWFAGITTVLVLLYTVGTWNYDTFRKRNMKFLAPKVPFIGNIGPVFTGKMSYPTFVAHLYNSTKGWAYAGLFEFRTPFILLRDPELIKMITVKYFDHFTSHRNLVYPDLDPMLARSVGSLKGDEWRKMRQCISPVFSASRLKTQFHLLKECTQYTCDYLQKRLRQFETSNQSGNPMEVDMKDVCTKWSMNVVASIAFGTSINAYEDPNNAFCNAGKKLLELFLEGNTLVLGGYMLWPKLMHLLGIPMLHRDVQDFLHHAVQSSMAQRSRNRIPRPDVIQSLLSLKERQDITTLSDKDMSAIATNFFAAGFESVSTLLFFICYLLALHPEIQQRAQGEVDRVLEGCNATDITFDTINNMPYLEMVFSESARLYPTLVTVDRVCEKTCSISYSSKEPPITIKAGDHVTIPIFALHHDPEYFPDPYKFDPERFSEENIKNIKPHTYIPFGHGPRKCIGQRFAQVELKLMMCNLLAQFTFCVVDATPIPMAIKKRSFLMVPEGGYTLGVFSRTR